MNMEACRKHFAHNIYIVLQDVLSGIQCQLCHMMFDDQSAINAHYDTAHSQRRDFKHECDVCGKKYAEKSTLKRHLSTIHAVGDVKTFQCDVCSRIFKYKWDLAKHIKKAHGQQ